jgi:hypothetical protein
MAFNESYGIDSAVEHCETKILTYETVRIENIWPLIERTIDMVCILFSL